MIDISKHDKVEHFVQVDDHSEDIAEGENHNDSSQYDSNALISSLPGGCLLIHAACSLHRLVEHSVEDREDDEGNEDHHHKVGDQNVISDVVRVVPERGGAHGDVDRLPGHDDPVLLEADVQWRYRDRYWGSIVFHLDAGVEFKPSD